MEAMSDDLFRAAYGEFAKNHDRLRNELMAKLPTSERRAPQPAQRSRRFVSIAGTLAAMLLVGAFVAGLVVLRPQPAYGLADLRQRLLTIDSLYVKGWIYERTKTKFGVATVRFPVERYYKRPGTYYMVSYGFSSNGNDDLQEVTKMTMADDGKQAMVLVEPEKKAYVGPASDSLQAELMVENGLQVSEIMLLLGGVPENFERVGNERIRDQQCDIYESKRGGDWPFLWRVWLDPQTGIPARVVVMSGDGDEEPQIEQQYDVIQANVDPPKALFKFKAPKDFEQPTVTETKAAPAPSINAYSSDSSGDRSASLWVAIKLNDNAVLMCWSQSTQSKEDKAWFKDLPQIALEGTAERECTERALYETLSSGLQWRWSIVAPKDGKPIGTDSLSLKFSSPKGGSMSLGGQPLVFPGDRLAEIVERVQKRSLEESGELQKALPLEKLLSEL